MTRVTTEFERGDRVEWPNDARFNPKYRGIPFVPLTAAERNAFVNQNNNQEENK